MHKVLYRRFTAMRSKAKSAIGPVIIERAKALRDEMKITDKCTF
jgi:hypothetical protein